MATCPVTRAVVRTADCQLGHNFARLDRGGTLHVAVDKCSVPFAPPSTPQMVLSIVRRAKVRLPL